MQVVYNYGRLLIEPSEPLDQKKSFQDIFYAEAESLFRTLKSWETVLRTFGFKYQITVMDIDTAALTSCGLQ